MILYDWQCTDCGAHFEAMSNMSEKETDCKFCGGLSVRQISAPRAKLDPISGHFPDATRHWEKLHTPKSRGGKGPEINYFKD